MVTSLKPFNHTTHVLRLVDHHCIQLVKEGVTEKLLCLLKQPDIPPTLQHAVFSALRNMAIPSEFHGLYFYGQALIIWLDSFLDL